MPKEVYLSNDVPHLPFLASTVTFAYVCRTEQGVRLYYEVKVEGRFRGHKNTGSLFLPGRYETKEKAQEAAEMLLATTVLLEAREDRTKE